MEVNYIHTPKWPYNILKFSIPRPTKIGLAPEVNVLKTISVKNAGFLTIKWRHLY
jgi:hypothetical protein